MEEGDGHAVVPIPAGELDLPRRLSNAEVTLSWKARGGRVLLVQKVPPTNAHGALAAAHGRQPPTPPVSRACGRLLCMPAGVAWRQVLWQRVAAALCPLGSPEL